LLSFIPARKTAAALLVGAFALSACGGGNPTAAPSTSTATQAAPSTAASLPAASQPAASDLPASAPPASGGGTGVDPADDIKIAAPYALEPLNEQIAQVMLTQLQQQLGSLASVFDIGVRSVTKDGGAQPVAIMVVMSFPGLPTTPEQLLDGAANGSAGAGGSVESRDIDGHPARIVSAESQTFVLTLVGDDLVMAIATSGAKKDSLDVATAIINAN
jgi:hypothetical protein